MSELPKKLPPTLSFALGCIVCLNLAVIFFLLVFPPNELECELGWSKAVLESLEWLLKSMRMFIIPLKFNFRNTCFELNKIVS